jgi:hypothetical protein
MLKRRRAFWLYVAVVMLLLVLSGCASTSNKMRPVPPESVVTAPDSGQSMVVFMRPSSFGFAIQSSVFELAGDSPSLIGIVSAKTKVAHQVPPGENLFMVIGESADFMSANLEPDKTYFALVTPRMGAWKARFSLKPVHADALDSSDFNEWFNSCEWVEKIPEADNWASANMQSITSKQTKYYEKWMGKDESARPRLLPQDGK